MGSLGVGLLLNVLARCGWTRLGLYMVLKQLLPLRWLDRNMSKQSFATKGKCIRDEVRRRRQSIPIWAFQRSKLFRYILYIYIYIYIYTHICYSQRSSKWIPHPMRRQRFETPLLTTDWMAVCQLVEVLNLPGGWVYKPIYNWNFISASTSPISAVGRVHIAGLGRSSISIRQVCHFSRTNMPSTTCAFPNSLPFNQSVESREMRWALVFAPGAYGKLHDAWPC